MTLENHVKYMTSLMKLTLINFSVSSFTTCWRSLLSFCCHYATGLALGKIKSLWYMKLGSMSGLSQSHLGRSMLFCQSKHCSRCWSRWGCTGQVMFSTTLLFQRCLPTLLHHGCGLAPLQNRSRVQDEVLWTYARRLTFEKWTKKVCRPSFLCLSGLSWCPNWQC